MGFVVAKVVEEVGSSSFLLSGEAGVQLTSTSKDGVFQGLDSGVVDEVAIVGVADVMELARGRVYFVYCDSHVRRAVAQCSVPASIYLDGEGVGGRVGG